MTDLTAIIATLRGLYSIRTPAGTAIDHHPVSSITSSEERLAMLEQAAVAIDLLAGEVERQRDASRCAQNRWADPTQVWWIEVDGRAPRLELGGAFAPDAGIPPQAVRAMPLAEMIISQQAGKGVTCLTDEEAADCGMLSELADPAPVPDTWGTRSIEAERATVRAGIVGVDEVPVAWLVTGDSDAWVEIGRERPDVECPTVRSVAPLYAAPAAPVARVEADEALHVALGAYWDAAYAEGREGRDHDTPDGAAQRALAAVHAAVGRMIAAPVAQPQPDQAAEGRTS